LVYIGALEELFQRVADALGVGGWFAFSIEECAGSDFKLLPTGRFAHSHSYIRRLAESAFVVAVEQPTVIRTEARAPIAGRLYVLQKS
jgi:predicted TPR repeat methyltransferase